jgi:5-methylcytosine-specific restriction endonuclease McrA
MRISGQERERLRRLRNSAFIVQRGLCYWCEQPMKPHANMHDPRLLTGDHIIRLADGGRTVHGNVVAACRRCNNGRHSWRWKAS